MKERSGSEAKTASVVGERDLEVIPASQSGRAEEGVDEDEGVLIESRPAVVVVAESRGGEGSDASTPKEAKVSESQEFDEGSWGVEVVDDDDGVAEGFDSKIETSKTRSAGTAGAVEGEAGAGAGESGMVSKLGVKPAEGSRGGRSAGGREDGSGAFELELDLVVGLRGVAWCMGTLACMAMASKAGRWYEASIDW